MGFNIHLALPELDQSTPQHETGQKAWARSARMITYGVYEHLLELVIELDSDSTDL